MADSLFRLDGKVAIGTGASYGLGVIFANALADAGADIVATARSVDKLPPPDRINSPIGWSNTDA